MVNTDKPTEEQVVYVESREMQSGPSSYHIDTSNPTRSDDLREQLRQNELWYKIRRAGRSNPALQDILNSAIMLYELTKKNG